MEYFVHWTFSILRRCLMTINFNFCEYSSFLGASNMRNCSKSEIIFYFNLDYIKKLKRRIHIGLHNKFDISFKLIFRPTRRTTSKFQHHQLLLEHTQRIPERKLQNAMSVRSPAEDKVWNRSAAQKSRIISILAQRITDSNCELLFQ
jgi:hypothetical protein